MLYYFPTTWSYEKKRMLEIIYLIPLFVASILFILGCIKDELIYVWVSLVILTIVILGGCLFSRLVDYLARPATNHKPLSTETTPLV